MNPGFHSVFRRTVCLLPILLFTGAPFAAVPAESRGADQPEHPNILLVVADDLGWSDVGWHDGFGQTPHLDHLVRNGIELDQHYVQPVCTPTRTALMSGRYPGRFGPQAMAPSNLRAMPSGTVTLAAALQSVGYATALSGKWHLGSRPEWGPNHYGFASAYGTLTGAADPWTHKYRRGSPYEDTWHRNGELFHEDGNTTELIAAEAVRQIQNLPSPWFVYVPFHAVHTPVDAPAEFLSLYEGVHFDDDPQKQNSRLRMAAMVSQLDAKVAEFVAAIAARGQTNATLVIFTSDNGGIESLKNAYVGDVPDSPLNSENDPLRGQKNTLYEGGTRVCAFASWPGTLTPRRVESPMHVVDWFPTIAGIVGYKASSDLKWDGIDQWPMLSGAASAPPDRTIYIAKKDEQSIRQGDWKLISRKNGRKELFDISDDPFETTDLAGAMPEQVAALELILNEQRALDQTTLPADLVGIPD